MIGIPIVNASDIILKSAKGKLPSWGAWDILKATWLTWSRCLKEGTHGSTRGTIHDQRDVSQRDLDQRDCPSDWTRSQNHSAGRHRARTRPNQASTSNEGVQNRSLRLLPGAAHGRRRLECAQALRGNPGPGLSWQRK